jgi:hypothetical protein
MTEAGKILCKVGSVVQINEHHDPGDGSRMGWVGAFVLVTELKGWGVMGFVHHVDTHDKSANAYIRLKWEHIEFVGQATLVPQGIHEASSDGV